MSVGAVVDLAQWWNHCLVWLPRRRRAARSAAPSRWLPCQIQREHPRQNVPIAELSGPAISRKDGRIELRVRVDQPGRTFVIEIREGPSDEFALTGIRWVEPALPQLA